MPQTYSLPNQLYKRILNRRRYNFNLTTSILSGDFSPFSTFLAVLDIDSIYLTRKDLDKIMAADLSKFGIFCSAFRQVVPQGASIPAAA